MVEQFTPYYGRQFIPYSTLVDSETQNSWEQRVLYTTGRKLTGYQVNPPYTVLHA